MNIAVLSGKGGTGKTTVSTNLAVTLGISYVDLDVEEPNGFIFLNPLIKKQENVSVEFPVVDQSKCVLCGACAKVCQFHAMAKAGKEIVVFENLCHGCGACQIVCKTNALSYAKRTIGTMEQGRSGEITCYRGVLNVGEPMAVPVIRKVLKALPKEHHLLDCPPGTSCNVVASLNHADAAILITEPTEFGLHDLKMAIELVKRYKIPYGIIINKDNGQDNLMKQYCQKNHITLFGVVPYSMEAATFYSKGIMLYEDEFHKKIFNGIALRVQEAFL